MRRLRGISLMPERFPPEGVERVLDNLHIPGAYAIATSPNIHAAAHGYGPLEDVATRARTAWQAAGRRVWLNRYGYLSDAKLGALAALDWRQEPSSRTGASAISRCSRSPV